MVLFDPHRYAYPSRRSVVYARRAMACTSVPLGAQVGLDVMKAGGNAVDAAVAMAAAMPLLEPTGNGIGGDCFALVWVEREKKLYGLNASGVSPAALSAALVRERGFGEMPKEGWLPTMVPGAPGGWAELNRRFGTRPLEELFAPAASYAREGVAVPVNVAVQWALDGPRIGRAMERDPAPHRPWWERMMKADGTPYRAGEIFRWPEYADTLEELAATSCESFYRGSLMERMVSFSRETGGFFQERDLQDYRPEWVEPITADYKGYTVCEIPPNGHGITVLMALNILKGFEFKDPHSAETYHKQLEAMKLAFIDSQKYVADPRFMKTTAEKMLDQGYADSRRALIGDTARMPEAGDPNCGGTVYLCAADEEGNMISYIQSNYNGFGSCVVIPETGICLHNRGRNFYLDPASGNCIAPGKKPAHTIIPGFLTKDGKAVGPFGVMGAFMQPQGQVQVLMNTIDFHMNPQEALDAPRWQWTSGMNVEVERAFPYAATEELIRRGHKVTVPAESLLFGRGQIIWRDEDGVLCGGTESRTDGTVAAW